MRGALRIGLNSDSSSGFGGIALAVEIIRLMVGPGS
jgi:hypothetical protein